MTLAHGNRYLVSFNFTQRDDKKLPNVYKSCPT